MSDAAYSGLALADFNLENFAGYLTHDREVPAVELQVAPFGQVESIILNEQSDCWAQPYHFILAWTQPQSVIASFNDILNFKTLPIQDILKEVDDYAALLLRLKDRASAVFVPTWVLPPHQRGYGMLDMKPGFGMTNILMQMNLRLAEQLDTAANFYLLNTERWLTQVGPKAFNPKLWYMAKIPFGNEVFKEAVQDVKSGLRGISGQAKKLVVLDLDDTLWGRHRGRRGVGEYPVGWTRPNWGSSS